MADTAYERLRDRLLAVTGYGGREYGRQLQGPEGGGDVTRRYEAGAGKPTPTTGIDATAKSADATIVTRRPCRVCKRPGARPVVPIGSSRWWDLCHRCTGVVTMPRRVISA